MGARGELPISSDAKSCPRELMSTPPDDVLVLPVLIDFIERERRSDTRDWRGASFELGGGTRCQSCEARRRPRERMLRGEVVFEFPETLETRWKRVGVTQRRGERAIERRMFRAP